MSSPKIILYTSYICPWAHRAQIALHELAIPFETVHIDLSVPRTPEYLLINPRGLVPAISIDGEIITESGIVSQFLADRFPSHLLKKSDEEGGALQRARVNFFVDAWFSKVNGISFAAMRAQGEEKAAKVDELVEAVKKEIEPLLKDAKPFFGGSEKLTLAEVQTASFVIRVISFANYPELLPKSILKTFEEKTPNFWKWASVVTKQESVTYVWNEKEVATRWIGIVTGAVKK